MNEPTNNSVRSIAPAENGRMLDGEKEQTRFYAVSAYANGKFEQPITVRCWMSRSRNASVVYASVWADSRRLHTSGHGKAGGYGYDRASAAIFAAFRSAGITMEKNFAGVGESAVRDALSALARQLGYDCFTIVEG